MSSNLLYKTFIKLYKTEILYVEERNLEHLSGMSNSEN